MLRTVIIILCASLMLAACGPSSSQVTATAPVTKQVEFQKLKVNFIGKVCIDQNSNKICDSNEVGIANTHILVIANLGDDMELQAVESAQDGTWETGPVDLSSSYPAKLHYTFSVTSPSGWCNAGAPGKLQTSENAGLETVKMFVFMKTCNSQNS
jgi:hypothetical protein